MQDWRSLTVEEAIIEASSENVKGCSALRLAKVDDTHVRRILDRAQVRLVTTQHKRLFYHCGSHALSTVSCGQLTLPTDKARLYWPETLSKLVEVVEKETDSREPSAVQGRFQLCLLVTQG